MPWLLVTLQNVSRLQGRRRDGAHCLGTLSALFVCQEAYPRWRLARGASGALEPPRACQRCPPAAPGTFAVGWGRLSARGSDPGCRGVSCRRVLGVWPGNAAYAAPGHPV